MFSEDSALIMEIKYPDFIFLEDYDETVAGLIHREVLLPYLNEIFNDLYERQKFND